MNRSTWTMTEKKFMRYRSDGPGFKAPDIAARICKAVLSFMSAWLSAAVAVPFMVSCEISGGSGPDGSFGFPYADFEVDGMVVDETGQPLYGIRVYCVDRYWGLTYTDVQPDGRFSLYGNFTPSDNITIRAVDNSDVNWGVYFDTTVTVPLDFQEDSYSEIDEWFVGVYTGEVQIVMVRDTSIPW